MDAMPYTECHGYVLSDDFERFMELLDAGCEVVALDRAGNNGAGVFRPYTKKTYKCGSGRYRQRLKFMERGILFIDPRTVFDPDAYRLSARVFGNFGERLGLAAARASSASMALLETAGLLRNA